MRIVRMLTTMALLVLVLGASVFAAGLDSWINLSGYEADGTRNPSVLSLSMDGLTMLNPKGYYTDNGHYSGVIYKIPIDPKGLEVEFTIDKVAGYGNDTWIGIHLFNKPVYFSVSAPEVSQGVVTLIRPKDTEYVAYEIFEHVDAFNMKTQTMLDRTPEGKYVVRFEKVEDGYSYSVDGQEHVVLYGLEDVFAGGKVYLSFGASTDNGEPIRITINRINGRLVSGL